MKSNEVEVRRSVFTVSSFPSHRNEKDEVVTKFCETPFQGSSGRCLCCLCKSFMVDV